RPLGQVHIAVEHDDAVAHSPWQLRGAILRRTGKTRWSAGYYSGDFDCHLQSAARAIIFHELASFTSTSRTLHARVAAPGAPLNEIDFTTAFRALTGMTKPEEQPFPWQRDLYQKWFSQGKFPDACTLPTGVGKTSVIAIWLIALANRKPVPRRLVYVVNRRTVVDQTTDEVEKYRENLAAAGIPGPLAISTLRGQFADSAAWSADPSRPAVICGTVDMIGSRLLFSGYGIGFKSRPLHAGFLGQDALLVHDEAHLEPAFQDLITAIQRE